MDQVFSAYIGFAVGSIATIAAVMVCAIADLPAWIGIGSLFFAPVGTIVLLANSAAFWRRFG